MSKHPKMAKYYHTQEMQTMMPGIAMYEGESYDKLVNASLSKYCGWLSPISFGLACFNWLSHLSMSPAKQMDVTKKACSNYTQFLLYTSKHFGHQQLNPCIESKINDHRFDHDLWNLFPFDAFSQGFLLYEQVWDETTTGVRGVAQHHLDMVNFVSRQMLDVVSPSNYAFTNPEVLMTTFYQGGINFVNGYQNLLDDISRAITKSSPAGSENFKVGENLATTPGKVVYRNDLIELIQYEPTTATVHKEPMLIVPAWIMKYYILDLSPHNSLVKYFVNQGHTVFMISWKNPKQEDRNLGLEDYVNLGVMSALTAINTIVPDTKVNAIGYCIGGTLLMIAAGFMAGKSDDRFNTISLFAAQVDFKEAGELSIFIDESQITYLEDIMWEKGYFDGKQMAGAFSMLRSSELIWSRLIRDYLLGERQRLFDIMAWDHDTTRLPYKMHSEYLRKLFYQNQLTQGKFSLFGKRVALGDINTPMFAVSTVSDHVAPWKSVYKIHLYTKTDVTFILTTGGHNAGIVSEPNHPNRSYQMMTRSKGDKHMSSDHWHEIAPKFKGSWWPELDQWLTKASAGEIKPPSLGKPDVYPVLCDAPGTYVFQK